MWEKTDVVRIKIFLERIKGILSSQFRIHSLYYIFIEQLLTRKKKKMKGLVSTLKKLMA